MASINIEELSQAERLELLDRLWDSLDKMHLPLTAAQLDELDRRLATADADVAAGKTWAEFKGSLPPRLK